MTHPRTTNFFAEVGACSGGGETKVVLEALLYRLTREERRLPEGRERNRDGHGGESTESPKMITHEGIFPAAPIGAEGGGRSKCYLCS